MSESLERLKAESDILAKECNENSDPHKIVNHNFLEGFNYALANVQALEETELNDNQKIVLEWLKSNRNSLKVPMLAIYELAELPDENTNLAYRQLDSKQEFEVLAAFAQWGLKQEEAE